VRGASFFRLVEPGDRRCDYVPRDNGLGRGWCGAAVFDFRSRDRQHADALVIDEQILFQFRKQRRRVEQRALRFQFEPSPLFHFVKPAISLVVVAPKLAQIPLVEYSRQNGFIDKDFDIDKQIAESQEITLKTPYAREFRNIASLFWLMVKCPPAWMPFLRKVVSLPDNVLFRIIGSFNMVQELLFYRVRPIPALRYFKNTVLMTGKSGLSMTMRTIPSLFRKKERAPVLAQREIYEANRGYF